MIEILRSAARGALERVLVGSGAAARSRRREAGRVAVLAYHDVVPDREAGRGDVSLHLGLDRFRRQLDRLLETHRVVPLPEAVAGQEGAPPGSGGREGEGGSSGERVGGGSGGPEGRPAAALTFDDGYRGVLRHAVPELVARGLPATVFVCPGLLGEEGFWWDRVADTAQGPSPERRSRALGELGGRQSAVLEAFGGAAVPDDYRPITRDELRELASRPGITVASHTWSHPDLTALDDGELRRELARSREWLAREVPPASFLGGHLTFPYGHWDGRVAAAARAAGYRYLYRVEGGLAWPTPGGGVLPRINVPAGVSLRGFELRASGVWGTSSVASRARR